VKRAGVEHNLGRNPEEVNELMDGCKLGKVSVTVTRLPESESKEARIRELRKLLKVQIEVASKLNHEIGSNIVELAKLVED
jgi:hypothetical protein